METFITLIILGGILYGGIQFSRRKHLVTHEEEIKPISLVDYEKNLNKIFKYDKVKTVPLYDENRIEESKNNENVMESKEIERDDVENTNALPNNTKNP